MAGPIAALIYLTRPTMDAHMIIALKPMSVARFLDIKTFNIRKIAGEGERKRNQPYRIKES
ncbi:hypothetical protein GCM10011446_04230 [Acinetobacter vivianii]|nr:hypothetical protein GCM10011446_04230 [Acinetobacter vivianii]